MTLPFSASIPGSLPGSFTNYGSGIYGLVSSSFPMPSETGVLPSTLPFSLSGFFGPASGSLSPNYVQGVGWEVKVFSGETFAYMTTLSRYESLSFSFELSSEGSGQVMLDRSDPVFQSTLCNGVPGTELTDEENVWQCLYNGQPIFEFLGTSIDEKLADAGSETQPITIGGAGTARTLSWGRTADPGFPNVVYKLASLVESFQFAQLNPTTWNLTSPSAITSGQIYVDTSNSGAAITGANTSFTGALALSAGYYDATSSAISAKITPINMPQQATNLIVNGSFALGTTSWDTNASAAQAAGATAVSWTTDSFDGDNLSCQVTAPGSFQGIEQTVPALLPKTNYQLNAWVKLQTGTATPQITLIDSTNNKSGWPNLAVACVVGEWVLLDATIVTGATANVSLICSIASTGTSTFLVDTVFLYEYTPFVSEAMTLAEENDPAHNYVSMQLDFNSGQLSATVVNNGIVESFMYLTNTYDPVQFNYWRIREYAGNFLFDTAPDGGTWTNQGTLPYAWNAKAVSLSFSGWWGGKWGNKPGFTPMLVSDINTSATAAVGPTGVVSRSANQGSTTTGGFNISQASTAGLQNAYLEVPNALIWLDLFSQSQNRGSLSFIQPTFTNALDSSGVPWSDTASLIITNGTDLESQFEATAVALNADWVMYPNFQLYLGNDGSLGEDRSSEVVFYNSGHMISHDRLRVRDQIANYVIVSDATGNLAYQTNPNSVAKWNQREQYIQSSQATDIGTLEQLANAALIQFQDEIAQRTMQVPPELPGRTAFVDYFLGDWVGVQNANLSDIDKVRVVGIAISVDGTQDIVTLELTLETRIQLLIERMNVLLQKIGATADSPVLPALGAVSQIVTQTINQGSQGGAFDVVVGDGVTTVFPIAHALETLNVVIMARDNGAGTIDGPRPALYTVAVNSINQVTLTFVTAPTVNQYTIIIKK